MKRIVADNPLLEHFSSAERVKRHNAPQEDKLAAILDQIHAKYSGSLSAFFDDLENDGPIKKTRKNGCKKR